MFKKSVNPSNYLVAESPAMRVVVEAVDRYAAGDAPVLVCGEPGTGRELVARILHSKSERRTGRFISVRPTFESSSVNSSESDVDQRARDALRAAQGGTLLVKDVCDVPAVSQRTLRRAIQKCDPREQPRRLERPDSVSDLYDVRVVGTADFDLEQAVDANIMCRNLYEQMRERRIDVPPLRHRGGDIPTLIERWVRHYADEVGRGKLTVSTRTHERLVKYPWPGNVAELKNLARRLVVHAKSNRIEPGDLDEILPTVAERVPLEDLAFEDMVKSKLTGFLSRMDGYPVKDLYEKILERVERPLFALVLENTGGNQLKAAEILGLNRNTLRRKLETLGIERGGARSRGSAARRTSGSGPTS